MLRLLVYNHSLFNQYNTSHNNTASITRELFLISIQTTAEAQARAQAKSKAAATTR